jgi:hypothetical protein
MIIAAAIVGALALFLVISRRGDRVATLPPPGPPAQALEGRAALERTRDAVKEPADEWEAEREGWAEDEGDAGGTVAPPAAAEGWAEVTEDGGARNPEELEQAYLEGIARLPYGIPSLELAGWNRTDLAAAMSAGERRRTADGRELVLVRGRWYYSDPEDPKTFLREHGS